MDISSGESVNSVVVSTKQILIDSNKGNKINLFGRGNRKRDIELLLRGDIFIPVPVQASMFVCRDCGHMSTIVRPCCINCYGGRVYVLEGVWLGTVGIIVDSSRNLKGVCEDDDISNGYRICKV